MLAKDLGCASSDSIAPLLAEADAVARMLNALRRQVERERDRPR